MSKKDADMNNRQICISTGKKPGSDTTYAGNVQIVPESPGTLDLGDQIFENNNKMDIGDKQAQRDAQSKLRKQQLLS